MGERQGGLRRRDFLAAALAGTAAAMVAVPDARGQARARPTPAVRRFEPPSTLMH